MFQSGVLVMFCDRSDVNVTVPQREAGVLCSISILALTICGSVALL